MSAGAHFVRADLHVHTRPDVGEARWSPEDYVKAALAADLKVLAITDHNTVDGVQPVLEAASGTGLLVLPGIEITTHEGHLLALFAPEALDRLRELAGPSSLRLEPDPRDGSLRSARSMLDLAGAIDQRGGLAIPAHVDAKDGIHESMPRTALAQLLAHPGLAGLEFARHDALIGWFSDTDADPARRAAWDARQAIEELAARGLGRLMSSDAHSPEKVGGDRPSRTLTRLRLDEPTFDAVRNAVKLNPSARCKAEPDLPAAYPRVLSASFGGGFLDRVTVELSPNLSCLIGGRGSGKSTALIAIRAALGADMEGDDDPDDPDRMPETTTVRFLDRAGSERVAVRERGGTPYDATSGGPVRLEVADMGQGASGRLAERSTGDPAALRRFLDVFVDLERHENSERELLDALEDNAATVQRAAQGLGELEKWRRTVTELRGTLEAAKNSKVEELAQWATQLAGEGSLLEELDRLVAELVRVDSVPGTADLDQLALDTGTDLGWKPAAEYVHGSDGVRTLFEALSERRRELERRLGTDLAAAGRQLQEKVASWRAEHDSYQQRFTKRQRELEQQGLKVQAGEILKVSGQLARAREQVRQLTERQAQLHDAQRQRRRLLDQLHGNRGAEHERRKATLKQVVAHVNQQAEGLRIHLAVDAAGDHVRWCNWLREKRLFRSPRVERIAEAITPRSFAEALHAGPGELAKLKVDGAPLFPDPGEADQVAGRLRTYASIFELETMRLYDRVRIDVQEPGSNDRRPFDHLSAGQQRSVLLSLLLSADRDDPLIVDQPEDHLDARYIASSVVRQLEAAKEKRQVIIATHSANLAVLGDAELVVPMYASGGHGQPEEAGAVDRPATRERVCELLEGGREAYRRRGERYGFDVDPVVPDGR
jgi:predicted ATPase